MVSVMWYKGLFFFCCILTNQIKAVDLALRELSTLAQCGPCVRMAGDGAISSESLREKLRRELQAEHVEVEDTSPNHCSTSFKVLVVSTVFEGKPLLARHRLVNGCLSEELKEIHAFEQKNYTPAQWEQEKQKRG
ncbi:bolA-like protein 2 [Discoglossus pictus]